MASSSEVLPAPVGPVMAKRSKPEKSISHFSRKAVKPLTSSLIGRIPGLAVKLFELRQHLVGGRGALVLLHETGEEVDGRDGGGIRARRGRCAMHVLTHLEDVWQDLGDLLRQSRNSRLRVHHDTQIVIAAFARQCGKLFHGG